MFMIYNSLCGFMPFMFSIPGSAGYFHGDLIVCQAKYLFHIRGKKAFSQPGS